MRDLLSSPNFLVISSSSSTRMSSCFFLLLRIVANSLIVFLSSTFSSSSFSRSSAVNLRSGISRMCDAWISESLNFFIKEVLAVSASFDARITFIIWSILSKANIKPSTM